MLLNQARHFGKRRCLVFRVDRYMEERDAMPLDHTAQVVVVGNNTRNLAIQFVRVPTVQQIGQAVGLTAGHQHHALLLGRIGNAPSHGELFGNRRERFAERLDTKGQRFSADFMAHEEPTTLFIGVVAGFVDPAIVQGQEITDFRHDAYAVGAGDHQTIGAHELRLQNFAKAPILAALPEKRSNHCTLRRRCLYRPLPQQQSATA